MILSGYSTSAFFLYTYIDIKTIYLTLSITVFWYEFSKYIKLIILLVFNNYIIIYIHTILYKLYKLYSTKCNNIFH